MINLQRIFSQLLHVYTKTRKNLYINTLANENKKIPPIETCLRQISYDIL